MPTITSNFLNSFIKTVSATTGPLTFMPLFLSFLTEGIIYFFSSEFAFNSPLCGFIPKIAILGLNPHNAELRSDSEENKKIIPAIKKLRKLDIKVKGPLVSDTVFINDYKNYDIIIGMFHDQVLAPFKSMFKFDAINITLGLKYLRVSPAHGTATNLILKKKANPTSLIKCINFISKFKK